MVVQAARASAQKRVRDPAWLLKANERRSEQRRLDRERRGLPPWDPRPRVKRSLAAPVLPKLRLRGKQSPPKAANAVIHGEAAPAAGGAPDAAVAAVVLAAAWSPADLAEARGAEHVLVRVPDPPPAPARSPDRFDDAALWDALGSSLLEQDARQEAMRNSQAQATKEQRLDDELDALEEREKQLHKKERKIKEDEKALQKTLQNLRHNDRLSWLMGGAR